jgi:hypothetical protein
MGRSWELGPDGSYRALTATEDLLTDVRSAREDVEDSRALLREAVASVRDAQRESKSLVEESQRQRRLLRAKHLKLVRTPPDSRSDNSNVFLTRRW